MATWPDKAFMPTFKLLGIDERKECNLIDHTKNYHDNLFSMIYDMKIVRDRCNGDSFSKPCVVY